MDLKWYTKCDVAQRRRPVVFQCHPSNFTVTRAEKSLIWMQFEIIRPVAAIKSLRFALFIPRLGVFSLAFPHYGFIYQIPWYWRSISRLGETLHSVPCIIIPQLNEVERDVYWNQIVCPSIYWHNPVSVPMGAVLLTSLSNLVPIYVSL